MSVSFNHAVEQIQISGIRRFFNMMADYPDALSLTIGQPDFPTPEHIKEAAKVALDNNHTTYTANAGLLQLRVAAAQFVRRYGLTYDGSSEVIVTNGTTEGLSIAFQALLNPGDEVLLPGPVYPGYEPLIRMADAHPVYMDTTKTDFKVTPSLLKASLTDRTRCILIPYPSNPTGAVLSSQELSAVADTIRDLPLFVLSDEVYSELIYSGAHHSIAALPGMREKTVVLNGLSKSHAMTGWRIGFTFAPKEISAQMLKVHQYTASCAGSISQHAGLEALTNGLDDPVPMRDAYRKRGNYVHRRLTEMGLDCRRPSGAFYLFPSIRRFGMTSRTFALRLLREGGVAAVPGDAFSPLGEGFLRISYAVGMETLKQACNRMEQFIQAL